VCRREPGHYLVRLVAQRPPGEAEGSPSFRRAARVPRSVALERDRVPVEGQAVDFDDQPLLFPDEIA